MRILVIGKDGQLGRSIQNLIVNIGQTHDVVFTGRGELNLNCKNSIDCYFEINDRFDVIVNCAAYTSVDKAEEEQDVANQINHLAVRRIAEISVAQKAKFIHISTDYVFDGKSDEPYIEASKAIPVNMYGKTKLAGEIAVQEVMPINAVIIRTSWVYSEYGSNFVKTMLKLGRERSEVSVVDDQIGSPTYAADLAQVIFTIINDRSHQEHGRPTNIYHYSNKGKISWCQFARKIFELADIACSVSPIKTEHYSTLAERPKNTFMSKSAIIESLNMEICDWVDSLRICIRNLVR